MSGELSPGSTPRRYIPEGGLKKHNERIHRESKQYDNSNPQFTFSKPPRRTSQKTFKCTNCGHIFCASKNTVMVICSRCNVLSNVEGL